jgi:hypothetical protein
MHAFDRERFADFSLIRVGKAKNQNLPIPEAEKTQMVSQWPRTIRLEMVPHTRLNHLKAIEANLCMKKSIFGIDMRAPKVCCAHRRWSVDYYTDHSQSTNQHHLLRRNHQTLCGVESAALVPEYKNIELLVIKALLK